MKNRIIAISAVLLLVCSAAHARKVTGKVVSGDERLSGVIVTDGENFTRTKKNGKFAFDIKDDAEFVYIVTPSGYAGEWSSGIPAFYKRAEGQDSFTFELKKMETAGSYSIIAVSDPQSRNEKHFAKFAGKPLEDLCRTAGSLEGEAVGIVLGDICWDVLPLLEDYKKEIVRTGIPFYPVVGNHDHDRNASGDINATAAYRKAMCPENYAFFIGNDVVIVVDNIIYDTDKKYVEGYADHVINWVKGLEKLIPEDSDLYIAQHSPVRKRRHTDNRKIKNADEIFDIVRGHNTTFISGHSHVNMNYEFEDGIVDHNVAAICGAWWDTEHCTDGTPRGYKVYTKADGRLKWYYKPVDYGKDHQVEVFRPGQSPMHPNSVVLNVWDWDSQWKVTWFEDGRPMGVLKPVYGISPQYINEIKAVYHDSGKNTPDYKQATQGLHYFVATPSQYAKTVTVAVESRFGQKWAYTVDMTDYVDVQAHRGGAGLMPENTVAAMKNALDMGVNTLELDLQISADGQVVVSHDAYFHSRYGIRPDGSHILKSEPKEYIYTMPYDSVTKYDVGSRPSEVWKEKKCMPAVKPLASDLIDFVESYTKEMGYSPVRYNIEVKSRDADGEGKNWPAYDAFVDACAKLLISKHLDDRLVVQCFDVRALNFMHEKYPELILSYLVGAKDKDFDTYMAKLKFTPQWLSPHYTNVDEELIRRCREAGMKIVPWTADEPEDIRRMLDLKVDALISNYPDRVLMQTRGFTFPVLPDVK